MDRNEFERIAPGLRVRILSMVSKLYNPKNAEQAEDVVQDTLLRLWIIREKIRNDSNLDALAMIMARNMVIDSFRKSHIRFSDFGSYDPSDQITPHDLLSAFEAEKTMDSVLDTLPPAQRALIRMRHEEGMSITDIASAIGSTEGAVRTALSRARRHVMELFKKMTNG